MVCVGDFVFAKMRGFPPWPAVVERIVADKSRKFSNYSFEVYFYGTHQTGFVRETDLFPYKDNLEKFQSGSKRNKFCLALKEIEEDRSAFYRNSKISNDSVIRIKDCSVRLERIDLTKIPYVNIPRDYTTNTGDIYNASESSETQDFSDIECEYISSPKRLFLNKKFEDCESDCVLIEQESSNWERSSISRTKSIEHPTPSVVRRLFQERPAQQEEDIIRTVKSFVSSSRQLNTTISCPNSPIIFIESDEADSCEDESSHVQTFSRSSSQRRILEDENETEVELLTEVHGVKRRHRRPSSGFYDLPTPQRGNTFSESNETGFDNCDALTRSCETTNFYDLSTPKLVSKLSLVKGEFPNLRALRAKLKENGQNLQEWVFVHDLPTPRCQSTAVKSKDNFVLKCLHRPNSVRENKDNQESSLEDSVNKYNTSSHSQRNHARDAEGISKQINGISSNELRKMEQLPTAQLDDSSCDESGQESLFLVNCHKNCLSLSNTLIPSRMEGGPIMYQEFGNSVVRTSEESDRISDSNSDPIEIDLVSDSSDEETISPCPKQSNVKSREITSVMQLSSAFPEDRKASFAYSRAMWKSRHSELYTSNESTESSDTLRSPDYSSVSEVLRNPVPLQPTLRSYENTYEESHQSPVTLSISEKLHKSQERSSALLESVGTSDLSVTLVEDCSTLQTITPLCEDQLHSEWSDEYRNNTVSLKYSKKKSNLSVVSEVSSAGNRALPTSEDKESTSSRRKKIRDSYQFESSDDSTDINQKQRNPELDLDKSISSNVHIILQGKEIVIRLQRLDDKIIQSYKSLRSRKKLTSGNLADGSKKRKMHPPKKRYSSDKCSSYSSPRDEVQSNEISRSAVEESAVMSGASTTTNDVGAANVDIRPVVSDAKTIHRFLRRKMFSLVRKYRKEDKSSLSATRMLSNEMHASGETKDASQESNVPSVKINGARQFDHLGGRVEEMDDSQLSSENFRGEPSNSIIMGEKRKCEKSRVFLGGKRGLKRCEVCWLMVENVTDHIINDHRDMFT